MSPLSRKRKPQAADRPRALWWLHPRFVVLYLGIPLLVLAYLIPRYAYVTLYRTEKYVDPYFVLVALIVYLGFIVGTFVQVNTGKQPQQRDILMYCRWVIWPLFVFTVFGYVAWFASATLQAGGPGTLLSTLLNLLLQPESGASDYIKYELFQTIPGLTTFTQFGILYATVEALLWVRGGSHRRVALARFSVLLAFTLVRAFLLSERLALVEFVVPLAVIYLSRARWTLINNLAVRLAPLLAAFGVFVLFAVSEYFRSWNFYQTVYSGSYLRFASDRFFGYYTTALNNAAVHFYYGQVEPLKSSLNNLFEFPGLGGIVGEAYRESFSVSETSGSDLLNAYANVEFNNVALVGGLLTDFSPFLAPLAAFVIGVVSFSIYKSFVRGRLLGVLLYPSWFIGLLEFSRIYYWPGGRYFPSLAFLLLSLILFKLVKGGAGSSTPANSFHRRVGRHAENDLVAHSSDRAQP